MAMTDEDKLEFVRNAIIDRLQGVSREKEAEA
jgi:hypothetical protein